jgi:hypothetical protein
MAKPQMARITCNQCNGLYASEHELQNHVQTAHRRFVSELVRTQRPSMTADRYVVMRVECQYCKTNQKVHVAARTGFAQTGDQTIQCIMCSSHSKVAVLDKIVGGPFPL